MSKLPPDAPTVAVVGSINLDFVATGARLPNPGETVTGATLARHPGGKGANQALAARRMGAHTTLYGRVGKDAIANEVILLLMEGGVHLTGMTVDPDAPTGVALIAVAPGGENQIVVCPGANATFTPDLLGPVEADAVIGQLEVPAETVLKAAAGARKLFAVNLAPARDVPDALFERADLLIVNETEAEFYGAKLQRCPGLVATTYGQQGAVLRKAGAQIALATPPKVKALDTVGAGDSFVAALVVSLVEGREPQEALRRACTAGALATTKSGAQPSLPYREAVEEILRAS
jgi:ribokinase